jgi:hypothetical protein
MGKIPNEGEVVVSKNVTTSIKKKKLVEIVRESLPPSEMKKLSPMSAVSISRIFLSFGEDEGDNASILVTWREEEHDCESFEVENL